ncbi:MAG TPA: hypothetical protein VLZ50_16380 [Terracidiphilus sp.]|nr:hypothetical protein [Terracidiphilus sp.]
MKNDRICVFVLVLTGSLAWGAPAQRRGSADRAVASGDARSIAATMEKRLADNPSLASRIQLLLPPGSSLEAAASGFNDETQFVAALHVSRNLNLPFNELKADLRRSKYSSLTQALQDLRPELRTRGIDSQIKKAERQAKADLQLVGEVASN